MGRQSHQVDKSNMEALRHGDRGVLATTNILEDELEFRYNHEPLLGLGRMIMDRLMLLHCKYEPPMAFDRQFVHSQPDWLQDLMEHGAAAALPDVTLQMFGFYAQTYDLSVYSEADELLYVGTFQSKVALNGRRVRLTVTPETPHYDVMQPWLARAAANRQEWLGKTRRYINALGKAIQIVSKRGLPDDERRRLEAHVIAPLSVAQLMVCDLLLNDPYLSTLHLAAKDTPTYGRYDDFHAANLARKLGIVAPRLTPGTAFRFGLDGHALRKRAAAEHPLEFTRTWAQARAPAITELNALLAQATLVQEAPMPEVWRRTVMHGVTEYTHQGVVPAEHVRLLAKQLTV